MLRILLEKVRDLIAGERGSALALTLAFLLPVYLLVIGIYGVSETVYRKIQLQNAADAAAYSAATVQADYLSRIAVLNKAVAWSYADMVKRQLDLGVAMFFDQTYALFMKDFALSVEKNLSGGCPEGPEHTIGVNWNTGNSKDIMGIDISIIKDFRSLSLYWGGSSYGTPQSLEAFNEREWLQRFVPLMLLKVTLAELNGQGVIANTAKVYTRNSCIGDCHDKLAAIIKDGEMKTAIEKAANDVLDLNLREVDDEVLRYVRVGDPDDYLSALRNSEDDEKTLLKLAVNFDKDEDYDQKNFFQEGIGFWYKRSISSFLPFIMRGYHQRGKDDKKDYGKYFHSEWSYFWAKWWKCPEIWSDPPIYFPHLPPFAGGDDDYKDRVYDANKSPYFGFYDNVPIVPGINPTYLYTLNAPLSAYGFLFGTLFGKEGTVVVGLARKNTNPLRLFGSGGLVTAFDAKACGTSRPDYIWAISAARAAYNSAQADYRKPKEMQEKLKSPRYSLGYGSPSEGRYAWNLREADWDAMFVPVRYANYRTESMAFVFGDDDILDEIMTDRENWKKKDGDEWKSAEVDWSEIAAPGGDAFAEGDDKLDWAKLSEYLYH